MKRIDMIKTIEGFGCVLIRHGAMHDWYRYPQTGVSQPVPRHREINENLAKSTTMTSVYIFPSNSKKNIVLGIESGVWAVPRQKKKPSMIGKARSMSIGDRVLLYLNGDKVLYGIFRVTKLPDEARVISDVWAGDFELPFEITLCAEQKDVGRVYAPFLKDILPSLKGAPGAWSDHITKFRGMTIFQRQDILDGDMAALAAEFARSRARELGIRQTSSRNPS